ncbi:MAG: TetR/AcrR family transcriptional regulator [Bacillota bacterium]
MDVKERIFKGYRDLAFSVGFHAATVDDLSAATGISKRTIYRYYRSKEELISAVIDELLSNAEKGYNKALSVPGTPVEKITSLIVSISKFLKTINPLIIRDLQKYYPHMWERIEKFRAGKALGIINILSDGNSSGYFRETIPQVFTTALLSSIRDVLNPGFLVENNLTPDQAAVCLFNIFLFGIVSGKADITDGSKGESI